MDCFGNNIHVIDVSCCPILTNLIRSEEYQISDFGYDWGAMNGPNGFIRIDNYTIFLEFMNIQQLPFSLTTIEKEAFANSAFQAIFVPDGCTTIGERAFADCSNLLYIRIPASVKNIPDNAFEGCNEYLVIDWRK